MGEVGGLGAGAIYGYRQLNLHEFNEAWAIQQAILQAQADAAHDNEPGHISERSLKKTLRLERQGKLDAAPTLTTPVTTPVTVTEGDAGVPRAAPMDPSDPNFDPDAFYRQLGIS